jgi:hypothetical protein
MNNDTINIATAEINICEKYLWKTSLPHGGLGGLCMWNAQNVLNRNGCSRWKTSEWNLWSLICMLTGTHCDVKLILCDIMPYSWSFVVLSQDMGVNRALDCVQRVLDACKDHVPSGIHWFTSHDAKRLNLGSNSLLWTSGLRDLQLLSKISFSVPTIFWLILNTAILEAC